MESSFGHGHNTANIIGINLLNVFKGGQTQEEIEEIKIEEQDAIKDEPELS